MTQLTDLYHIDQYIDTFALGHYARVLAAVDQQTGQQIAFKVMRPEHVQTDGDIRWEFRAFGNEAEILQTLQASPHVVNLRDCGYVATLAEAPADGEIASYGTDVESFTRSLTAFGQRGWRPYLTMDYLPRAENLFYLMKPTQPGSRRRLPTEEGIALALQFANVLAMAHHQNIVYLDHKLEHVYWDGATLHVIDFNSSKQLKNGANNRQEYIKDLHNLCVGILYPIFTGMSPQKTALLPQAGGLDVVNRRYEDINELDFLMEPSLSRGLQELLNMGAAQQLETTQEFSRQLQKVASQLGRDFPDTYTSPASRQARDNMRKGLKMLRDGENLIRDARDLFRDSLVLDGITEDLEDELRRLAKAVNDMLNERVIP
jgi:serine/threonine protein kinase